MGTKIERCTHPRTPPGRKPRTIKKRVQRLGLYVNWDGVRYAWFDRGYHLGIYKNVSLGNANRLLQAMRMVQEEFAFEPDTYGTIGWRAERQ